MFIRCPGSLLKAHNLGDHGLTRKSMLAWATGGVTFDLASRMSVKDVMPSGTWKGTMPVAPVELAGTVVGRVVLPFGALVVLPALSRMYSSGKPLTNWFDVGLSMRNCTTT